MSAVTFLCLYQIYQFILYYLHLNCDVPIWSAHLVGFMNLNQVFSVKNVTRRNDDLSLAFCYRCSSTVVLPQSGSAVLRVPDKTRYLRH